MVLLDGQVSIPLLRKLELAAACSVLIGDVRLLVDVVGRPDHLSRLDDLRIEVWTRQIVFLEELVSVLLEDEVLVRLLQEIFLSVVSHLLIAPELRMESLN